MEHTRLPRDLFGPVMIKYFEKNIANEADIIKFKETIKVKTSKTESKNIIDSIFKNINEMSIKHRAERLRSLDVNLYDMTDSMMRRYVVALTSSAEKLVNTPEFQTHLLKILLKYMIKTMKWDIPIVYPASTLPIPSIVTDTILLYIVNILTKFAYKYKRNAMYPDNIDYYFYRNSSKFNKYKEIAMGIFDKRIDILRIYKYLQAPRDFGILYPKFLKKQHCPWRYVLNRKVYDHDDDDYEIEHYDDNLYETQTDYGIDDEEPTYSLYYHKVSTPVWTNILKEKEITNDVYNDMYEYYGKLKKDSLVVYLQKCLYKAERSKHTIDAPDGHD